MRSNKGSPSTRVSQESRCDGCVDMDSESDEDLGALLESTLTLSRGLETLYSEHEVLLQALGEERDSEASTRAGDPVSHGGHHFTILPCSRYRVFPRVEGEQESDIEDSEEFGVQMKVEKTAALSDSLNRLRAGIDEAKVCRLSVPMV